MATSVFPTISSAQTLFTPGLPVPTFPSGLTLRNTYTSTTTGITGQPSVVFVVMSGGGGNGGSSDGGTIGGGGGGAGNIVMGYFPSFASCVVGGATGATYLGSTSPTASAGNNGFTSYTVDSGGAGGGILASETTRFHSVSGGKGTSGGDFYTGTGGSAITFLQNINPSLGSNTGRGGNGGYGSPTAGGTGYAGVVMVFW